MEEKQRDELLQEMAKSLKTIREWVKFFGYMVLVAVLILLLGMFGLI